MRIIKLNAIDSTNNYLKLLSNGIMYWKIMQLLWYRLAKPRAGGRWELSGSQNRAKTLCAVCLRQAEHIAVDWKISFYISMVTSMATCQEP